MKLVLLFLSFIFITQTAIGYNISENTTFATITFKEKYFISANKHQIFLNTIESKKIEYLTKTPEEETIRSITTDNNVIYFATNKHIYNFNISNKATKTLFSQENIEIYSITNHKSYLYTTTSNGIFKIDKFHYDNEKINLSTLSDILYYKIFNNISIIIKNNRIIVLNNYNQQIENELNISYSEEYNYLNTNIQNKGNLILINCYNKVYLYDKEIHKILNIDNGKYHYGFLLSNNEIIMVNDNYIVHYKYPEKKISKNTFYKNSSLKSFIVRNNKILSNENNKVIEIPLKTTNMVTRFNMDNFHNIIQKEPTINELQKAAIEYANVSQEKTKRWYKNAKLKAILPKLSINLEQSINNNIDIDRGSTTTNDFYISGPKEKKLNWEISIEWELGNFIWNEDATNIDYREKYLIETRDNILNKLTKLYFNRQEEILKMLSISPDNKTKYIRSRLNIKNLTAQIDALTGGYFSKRIKTNL